MRFLRSCLTLEPALCALLEEHARAICGHYGWHKQEIDDWVDSTSTSYSPSSIRPDLRLAEQKAKCFMVDTLFAEMGKLDRMNPETWTLQKYQAWCQNCCRYTLEEEACCEILAKQPRVKVCKHCSLVGHRGYECWIVFTKNKPSHIKLCTLCQQLGHERTDCWVPSHGERKEDPLSGVRYHCRGHAYEECWVAFPSKRLEWMKTGGLYAKIVPKKEREMLMGVC